MFISRLKLINYLLAVLIVGWAISRLTAGLSLFFLSIYGLNSVLCLVFYAQDKKRAEQGQWRITEAKLHCLELLGGWVGAFIAQHCYRHKSIKWSYQLRYWLIVNLHLVIWLDTAFFDAYLLKKLAAFVLP